ncbi:MULTISPECIES: outer membrane beta-barrel protein [unclassified Pseudomonas]|uniref:outer membrane beta-barrel protein n=1 Tax=unclassified Pseudomonas TaxID=196821 RepID=UPI00244D2DFF|nr:MULTISPECIES: outer membrane beta-barrel protein [unclassified Pseudomonas]MDH0303321.1 porin [Pseudomonas sp. GD04091]MDH1985345.1 porin [Pseudomonas sp. GD03689]
MLPTQAGLAAILLAGTASAEQLPSPSIASTLPANATPFAVDAGLLGKVHVSGQLTGLGLWQNHVVDAPGNGNETLRADLSNAQVELQTLEGPLQFYLQAGAYSLPALGSAYMKSSKAADELYGNLPVGYLKAPIGEHFSIMAGALPTLVGAESTFTFQNINIQRGLLWNQEPAISRGVQLNYAHDQLSASLSLNDGFYSGKYNWVSGSLAYALDSRNTLTVIGAGNFSGNSKSSVATPTVQNNSQIYNLIYTHADGDFSLSPYLQYTRIDTDRSVGIGAAAESYGAAILGKYSFNDAWALGMRAEYIDSKGADCRLEEDCTPTNLLYGAGSGAWSLTATPTYRSGPFFTRGELAYVKTQGADEGAAFGSSGSERDQVRVLVETGLMF